MEKIRSPRNHTTVLTDEDRALYAPRLCTATDALLPEEIINRTYNGDLFSMIDFFPQESVDLMIIDPPYNLTKNFGGNKFAARGDDAYKAYLESWFPRAVRLLKKDASLYICGDWKCTAALYVVVGNYLTVRNRITWQREKGRGAVSNWKNCCEDIWFATAGSDYYFNADAVKQKRRVVAPYRENGKPKDWEETGDGKFRLTGASNFWDDITVPYWSMSENTDHPTQKPEKLIAKLILASSRPGALVFDPFLGSGTTSVTAKKLGRTYCGIEVNTEYCLLAEKRLARADRDKAVQGYTGGVFWERNTGREQENE
ncbi:MAG TPA: site-specific DNA-methyltransferase [Treponema sp.]|nr:site-specific DNA-methyltransferase [Treponema sp.]